MLTVHDTESENYAHAILILFWGFALHGCGWCIRIFEAARTLKTSHL